MTKAEQRQAIAITADRSKRPRPMGFADVASGSAIRYTRRIRPSLYGSRAVSRPCCNCQTTKLKARAVWARVLPDSNHQHGGANGQSES